MAKYYIVHKFKVGRVVENDGDTELDANKIALVCLFKSNLVSSCCRVKITLKVPECCIQTRNRGIQECIICIQLQ